MSLHAVATTDAVRSMGIPTHPLLAFLVCGISGLSKNFGTKNLGLLHCVSLPMFSNISFRNEKSVVGIRSLMKLLRGAIFKNLPTRSGNLPPVYTHTGGVT